MPLSFTVKGTMGVYTIRMDRDNVRQDGTSGSLAYTAGWIMVKANQRQGKKQSAPGSLVALAASSGVPMEPTVRAWAFDMNPIGALVEPGMKLRLVGSMRIQRVRCDVVQLRDQAVKIDIVLRHRDGLPLRIDSHSLNGHGGDVGVGSARVFHYLSIGTPIPKASFVLRPDAVATTKKLATRQQAPKSR
jgi:hypothetical protein